MGKPNIQKLAKFILSFEGGYVNDPADAGGATNKGVTIATWKSQGYDKNGDGKIDVKDLKLISDQDAINVVMKPHYWNRWKADKINDEWLAYLLVDWVWGSGAYGITKVQKYLGVVNDGIVGPKTLAALNALDPKKAFQDIWKIREQYLYSIVKNRPANKKFLNGWLRRLRAMKYGSLTTNRGEIIK